MTDRLKALVTGAATGIGRSTVLALAKAGYDVAINYASSAQAARDTGEQAAAAAGVAAAAVRREQGRRRQHDEDARL